MAKNAYRVRNWRQYNEALVQRGSITLWFSEDVIKNWHVNDGSYLRGRPRKYSDSTIACGLTLKAIFKLTFRAVEGFIKSLIDLFKIKAEVPNYTSLCKRQKTLQINIPNTLKNSRDNVHILVDSTGVKVFGEGEWKVRQHGYTKRRLWRKLHLAVDANTQEIASFELTESNVQDGDAFPSLINQIDKDIHAIIGDGAYDQYKLYKLADQRGCKLIVPPNKKAKLTMECTGYSTKQKHTPDMLTILKNRDLTIEKIRLIGRAEWKKEIGYHKRSLVETAMFRMKTLLGTRLKSRKLAHQKLEAAIWCNIFNKMTKLGMPVSEMTD